VRVEALYGGGNWNNGTNTGLFYFNANNTASNANINISARLSYEDIIYFTSQSFPLGKNKIDTGKR
jgi:hypothetical protein